MEREVALFVDIHGHSRKKNIFMYGCNNACNDLKAHKQNSLIRMIPYVFSQQCAEVNFDDCKFANEKEKETTARLVVFRELMITTSFTLESTFYGCDSFKEIGFSKPTKKTSN